MACSFVHSTPSMTLRAVLLWELERQVPDGDHVQSASHIKHSLPRVPPAPPSRPSPAQWKPSRSWFPGTQITETPASLGPCLRFLGAGGSSLPASRPLGHLPAGSPPRCTPLNRAGGGLPIPHGPGLGPCWWVPQSWISGPLLSVHQVIL